MAVVGAAKPDFATRRQQYNGGVWTGTLTWLIQTDSWSDDADVVSTASGLPVFGEAHPAPVDAAMYANGISYGPREDKTPMAWTCTATYSSDRQLDPNDPELDEVLISFTSEIYQEAIAEDVDGNGILNSAGDPFDPVATRDAADLIARIKSNHKALPQWLLSYRNSTNDAAITILGLPIAAGQAKHQRMEVSDQKKRGTTTYYSLTQEIHIKEEGWHLRPLDQGLREILLGKKIHILSDGDLQEVTQPVPLNGAGVSIQASTPGNITYRDFTIYKELDFTQLPGIT